MATRGGLSSSTLLAALAALAALGACGDGGKKRPLGATCEASDECASGLCENGICIDPEGDEDTDGLSNALEVSLGTNVFDADSDGDGRRDPDELDANFAPRDSDGDGKIDAVESATADPDFDCLPDELDRRETTSDGAASPHIAELCPPRVGQCGAEGAALRVMCPEGLDKPVCDFAEVPSYEATETSCDALDNDCDGTVDEGCDALAVGLVGHWPLDGDGQDQGPYGDHGVVAGAVAAPDRFGQAGRALRFAAGDDAVTVATTHHPAGEVTASYALWVRPDPGPSGDSLLLHVAGTTVRDGSTLVLDGDRHCARYLGGSDETSATACAPGGHWSLLVVVKAGKSLRFYLDARLQGEATLAAGQALTSNALVIGGAPPPEIGLLSFRGVLDDLRIWDRALSQADIDLLFAEGGWQPAGTAANPAQSCLHVRDAGRGAAGATPASGAYRVDVDGDGARAPFDVYCDMTLDGGGWTLAWVYGFTDFADFQAADNAVTPVPSWPATAVTVPVSTTPPASPTTPGAIDWTLWRDLGRSFAVVSDLNDGIACEPGAGSLADGLDGWVECRTIVDVTQTCQGVVPSGLFFGNDGPLLYARDLYYYFDGSQEDGWPAHDPCGANSPQHVAAPAREGGALYLRETDRPVDWPGQCDWLSGLQRTDGVHRIDPDGEGGLPAFDVTCDFTTERGGWTRVSPAMAASMEARPGAQRQFLFRKGGAFYRSPHVAAPWTDTFTEAPGLWVYANDARAGAFTCEGGGGGETGIGCAGAEGRVLAEGALADGSVALCQAPPDAFGAGDACVEAEVWVREDGCVPDPGSLIGDGELDVVSAAEGSWQSPCWYAFGPDGWRDGFTADASEVPPEGRAPSLKVDNPTLGNDPWAVELGQLGVTLVAGRHYTLSFWARTATERTIRVLVQSSDLVEVLRSDLALGPEWQRHELPFAAATTMWNASVNLQLGQTSTATVWLDGFHLSDDGPLPQ